VGRSTHLYWAAVHPEVVVVAGADVVEVVVTGTLVVEVDRVVLDFVVLEEPPPGEPNSCH